jgi:hypothetical protein
MYLFCILSIAQKDLKVVSAGKGFFFLNLVHKNFVENLMSKLARSTLTSSGTIRVNVIQKKIMINFLI